MSSRKRILIVDDTPENLKILSDLLKIRYDISLANSGPSALEIINKSEKIDLILLDIMMPDMDGYEVIQQLKTDDSTKDIPVIFVTAMDSDEDESKGFAAGCVDYITKPVSPPIVFARIKTHLELKRSREKLERQNAELKEAAALRESVEQIARHDLKNPLTTIFSNIDYLLDFEKLTPDQTEVAEDIKQGAQDMLKMINSSLDLFKMEQGIYRPNPVDIDLLDILRRIEKDYKPLIELKNAGFTIMVDEKPVDGETVFPALGEIMLIYSMLANLIKNAVEAIPDNGEISISLLRDKNFATINIHNTGAVPENIRDNFFDKFVTQGKKSGTGLGTYSARLIAETLGGAISMDSSEKEGTNIFVQIPSAV